MAHSRGRVIVIEDDEGMRQAIESLLDAAGYATTAFASAEDLLAAGLPQDARCIVSDIRLPAMSGLELMTALRSGSFCPPVIVITAHDSAALRSEAGLRGAVAYLPKPFAGRELLAAIEGSVHRDTPDRTRPNTRRP